MVDTTKLWNRLLTWAPPANTGLETFLPIPLFLPFPTEMILFNAILGISNVCNTVVSYWFINNQRSIKIKPNHASNLTRKKSSHISCFYNSVRFDIKMKILKKKDFCWDFTQNWLLCRWTIFSVLKTSIHRATQVNFSKRFKEHDLN